MRSAIAWSYELLAPAERELFRRLSVFAGGFTLEAAEVVCDAGTVPLPGGGGMRGARQPTTIDLIGALVDQSLLTVEESPTGDSRFVMLDTVHTFAREQLFASGRSSAMEQRHAAWCLQLAEQAEVRLLREVDASWLDVVETEHDNIRSALEWALGPGHDDAEFALRIAGSLWLFWYYHSHLFEGRRWLERALQRSGTNVSTSKAKALVGLGTMAHCQGERRDLQGAPGSVGNCLRPVGDGKRFGRPG
jgi:predicted ATPase